MHEMKIESPCNDKCTNKNDYCTSCHRHINEITNWALMNDKEKNEKLSLALKKNLKKRKIFQKKNKKKSK